MTREQFRVVLANELQQLRTDAGMTVETLAAFVGNQRAWASKIAKGKQDIKLTDYVSTMFFLSETAGKNHPGVKLYYYIKNTRETRYAFSDTELSEIQFLLYDFIEIIEMLRADPDLSYHPAVELYDYYEQKWAQVAS